MKKKLLAALGLGAVVFATSQAAMAGVSVGLNLGAPVYVAPGPVYAPPPPPPAYYPDEPAYQPVVAAPAVVIGWHGDRYWDGDRWYGRREWYAHHGGYRYHRY